MVIAAADRPSEPVADLARGDLRSIRISESSERLCDGVEEVVEAVGKDGITGDGPRCLAAALTLWDVFGGVADRQDAESKMLAVMDAERLRDAAERVAQTLMSELPVRATAALFALLYQPDDGAGGGL